VHHFAAMRVAAAILICAYAALAQFKSTVPLVIAPTTVTDSLGRNMEGLTAEDLVLYDNNVPQQIQVDTVINPISLVITLQASSNSAAVLEKLGASGVLFSELLAADAGESALLTFSERIQLLQDFTADSRALTDALRHVRTTGDGAAPLEAIMQSLRLLDQRRPERRRIILVIAEKRDRSSKIKLPALIEEIERRNVTIYWLTYSPFLTPFTSRPKTPKKGEDPQPPPTAPGSLLSIFTELGHRGKPDAAEILSRATGGRAMNFLKQKTLETAIQEIAAEVHRQYILSFQPAPEQSPQFHAIRVSVKGHPELRARTRAGYWPVL
jgi:VWFA-related protein